MLNRILDGSVDFELSQRTALTHLDTPKTEKFYMSGPVKFDEKSQNCQTYWKLSILLPRES